MIIKIETENDFYEDKKHWLEGLKINSHWRHIFDRHQLICLNCQTMMRTIIVAFKMEEKKKEKEKAGKQLDVSVNKKIKNK